VLAAVSNIVASSSVTARCDLKNAIAPAFDQLSGQILGMSGLAVFIVIAALVGLLFLHASHHRGFLVNIIIVVLGVAILLSVAPAVLTAILPGGC
jgi:uncharacterized iron-regulated membrane protein